MAKAKKKKEEKVVIPFTASYPCGDGNCHRTIPGLDAIYCGACQKWRPRKINA